VEEVWATGEVPNLVIRGPKQPELVVPFADEFVPSVDLATQRIVIRPPEYVEVGRPGSSARPATAAPDAGGDEGESPDGEGASDDEDSGEGSGDAE
jgi:hypothetical protein